MIKVTENTFLLVAAQAYINPNCENTEEFLNDLKHFRYLKRLFNKYLQTSELKERLILNHCILIFNVFERKAATAMLFLKLRGYEHLLKPFLVALSLMPERVDGLDRPLLSSDIHMDQGVVAALRRNLP
jgi:hypothetical protein